MDPNPAGGNVQLGPGQPPPARASHLSAALRLQEEQQQRFHPQAHAPPHQVGLGDLIIGFLGFCDVENCAFQTIFRDAYSPSERKVVLEKRTVPHNGGILSPMTPPSPKVPRVSPVANTAYHHPKQPQQPQQQLQIPSPLTPQTPTTPHSPPAAMMSGHQAPPPTGPPAATAPPSAGAATMTAAERQRMRNIAASDYFRRMREEHARKEAEMQEARVRQVQHDLVLAREQVRMIPVPSGQQSLCR